MVKETLRRKRQETAASHRALAQYGDGVPFFVYDPGLVSAPYAPILHTLAAVFSTMSNTFEAQYLQAASVGDQRCTEVNDRLIHLLNQAEPAHVDKSRLAAQVPFPGLQSAKTLFYLISTLIEQSDFSFTFHYGLPLDKQEATTFLWETFFPHIPLSSLFSEGVVQDRGTGWRFAKNGNSPEVNLAAHAQKHVPEISAHDIQLLTGYHEGTNPIDAYRNIIELAFKYGYEIPLWQSPLYQDEMEVVILLDPKTIKQPILVHAARKLSQARPSYCVTTCYPLSENRLDFYRKMVKKAPPHVRPMRYVEFAKKIWEYGLCQSNPPNDFDPHQPRMLQKAYLDPVELYQPQL